MERKKASEFDQELLNLFDQYVHGGISRRDFMDGAGKFAVGGLTAAAIFEALRPNYAFAEQVPKEHTSEGTHTTPQPPQLSGSSLGLMHSLSHTKPGHSTITGSGSGPLRPHPGTAASSSAPTTSVATNPITHNCARIDEPSRRPAKRRPRRAL